MPDHFHALPVASSEAADFEELVRRFKQLTAFDYRRAHDQPLWQPGYHERILRDDEPTEAVAKYILENPIRAGLAKTVGEYALAWCEYDSESLLDLWHGATDRRT